MEKKVIKICSIIQILLSIVTYFSISSHFDADEEIFALLAHTDFIATMLRLSIYIVPGIHLLSGLYGLVFDEKKLLYIICVLEILSCALTFTFIGNSLYMFILSILGLVVSIIYFIAIVLIKK